MTPSASVIWTVRFRRDMVPQFRGAPHRPDGGSASAPGCRHTLHGSFPSCSYYDFRAAGFHAGAGVRRQNDCPKRQGHHAESPEARWAAGRAGHLQRTGLHRITCSCGARVTPPHTPISGLPSCSRSTIRAALVLPSRWAPGRKSPTATSAFPTRGAAPRFIWRCGPAPCPTDRFGRFSRGWAPNCPTTVGSRRTVTPTRSFGRRTGTPHFPSSG